MESEMEAIAESGALTLSDAAWAEARRRAVIVQPLADSSVLTQADVDIAAQELGLSARHICANRTFAGSLSGFDAGSLSGPLRAGC